MELTHRFTVPAPFERTWSAFNDVESVAGCFPGAVVTGVEGDSFEGSCKVKLGPIALVYNGAGTFVEKDKDAGRLVIDAKGKDKRGNGTAGAHVTATMSAAGESTDVEVVTDLAITGKPAQFGRGVMQDVSDKLLQAFVSCLETRLAGGDSGSDPDADPDTGPASEPAGAAAVEPPAGDPDAGPASVPAGAVSSAGRTAARLPPPSARPASPAAGSSAGGSAGTDDALDLGAAVLPVLVKSYGKQVAGGLVVLVVLLWLVRRLRR